MSTVFEIIEQDSQHHKLWDITWLHIPHLMILHYFIEACISWFSSNHGCDNGIDYGGHNGGGGGGIIDGGDNNGGGGGGNGIW